LECFIFFNAFQGAVGEKKRQKNAILDTGSAGRKSERQNPGEAQVKARPRLGLKTGIWEQG